MLVLGPLFPKNWPCWLKTDPIGSRKIRTYICFHIQQNAEKGKIVFLVVTTGCTQHPHPSHAPSVTLLLSVKGKRCQWQICLFCSHPTGWSPWRKPGRHTAVQTPLWPDTCTSPACVRSWRSAPPAPSHAKTSKSKWCCWEDIALSVRPDVMAILVWSLMFFRLH